MDDEVMYKDFIDLFDEDASTRLKAVLLKKDWILNTFYVPFSFSYKGEDGCEDDMDILFNSGLPFRKLPLNNAKNIKDLSLIKLFNSKFMFCKVYRSLPMRTSDDLFYLAADFKHLDKENYQKLVAAFFYCLPCSAFKTSYQDNDPRSFMKNALIGTKNEAVIILNKDKLDRGMFKVGCLKTLYTYSDMPEKEEKVLLKVADNLNIRAVMIHV